MWQRKQTSRKSRKPRVPKKLDPRKHTPRHIILTLPKMKEKENLKSSKRKGDSYLPTRVP